MLRILFAAVWAVLSGSILVGAIGEGCVPFRFWFWSTTLTRKDDKGSFWFVSAFWAAIFVMCVGLLVWMPLRAVTGQSPFDRKPFLPSSPTEIAMTVFFAVVLAIAFFFMCRKAVNNWKKKRLRTEIESITNNSKVDLDGLTFDDIFGFVGPAELEDIIVELKKMPAGRRDLQHTVEITSDGKYGRPT